LIARLEYSGLPGFGVFVATLASLLIILRHSIGGCLAVADFVAEAR
jgi:hypothetical protein